MVTNADGTTTALRQAQLGITEINLMGDATHIELPDGSVIADQTSDAQDNLLILSQLKNVEISANLHPFNEGLFP